MSDNKTARKRYKFRDYLSPKVLTMLALGFSSGLPFLLVGNTFGFWLRDEGVSLAAIGFTSWVGMMFFLQPFFAPLVDRLPVLRVLGQRRGWLLLTQIGVAAGLFGMAWFGLSHGIWTLCGFGLLVAASAAAQDIALAAWRIEIARDADELGLLTAANTLGYRIALICTDSLILVSAQHLGWPISYTLSGIAMLIGMGATLFAAEPKRGDEVIARKEAERPLWTPRGFFDAVVGPFLVFFKTHGSFALLMLAAISLYRLPDFVRGPMTNPFFHDIGMSKDVIGASRATIGLASVFVGIAVGGVLSLRLGYMRALMIGGVVQALGIAAHALLTVTGPDIPAFVAVMALDDVGISIAGITLVAYMSSLTSLGYTATQYALLSSTYAWAGKILKGFSGQLVETMTPHFGLMGAYAVFFLGAAAIGIPGVALFWFLDRRHRQARLEPEAA